MRKLVPHSSEVATPREVDTPHPHVVGKRRWGVALPVGHAADVVTTIVLELGDVDKLTIGPPTHNLAELNIRQIEAELSTALLVLGDVVGRHLADDEGIACPAIGGQHRIGRPHGAGRQKDDRKKSETHGLSWVLRVERKYSTRS